MDKQLCQPFAHVPLGKDDPIGSHPGKNPGVNVVFRPGDDIGNAEVFQDGGGKNAGLDAFTNGDHCDVGFFCAAFGKSLGVGGVRLNAEINESGGFLDAFNVSVHRNDLVVEL